MNEIRLELRARNNVLWHAIYDNFASIMAFSRTYKINHSYVGALLNLRLSPIGSKGKWRPNCQKLAETLGIEISTLFPLDLYKIENPMRVVEISFNQLTSGEFNQIKCLPSAESRSFLNSLMLEKIDQSLKTLTPREEEAVKLKFGLKDDGKEHTLEEIGCIFDVGSERIRQILLKALRKLRHPKHTALFDLWQEKLGVDDKEE